ncbi:hypothetical protein ACFVTC_29500 [Streptomyces sp. NPDC057950]|uniref:hypothetical protein n=1 Tax=Streptomyces sp. NPDC057950 TaxID=3346288 RepID=UPI0036E51D01
MDVDQRGQCGVRDTGSRPVLLLLRDSSVDREIQDLRALAMNKAVARIIASGRSEPGGAASEPGPETGPRAQLVLALFSGVVALRSMAPVEPLASVNADDLRWALDDVIDALIGSPPRSRRTAAGKETGAGHPGADLPARDGPDPSGPEA